jgi:hypothetical protein
VVSSQFDWSDLGSLNQYMIIGSHWHPLKRNMVIGTRKIYLLKGKTITIYTDLSQFNFQKEFSGCQNKESLWNFRKRKSMLLKKPTFFLDRKEVLD